MVIAPGVDFLAFVRLANALGNTANCICPSGFASVADLFKRCCPLPLAADDADFKSSLFLVIRIGLNRIVLIRVTLMLLIWVPVLLL